jgi:archaellum component FlaF (FlaF/FlaG flagellin family)
MKECFYCKSQVEQRATVCPFCTKEISKLHFIGQGLIGLILFIVIGYAAYLYLSFENYEASVETAKQKSQKETQDWYQKGETNKTIDLNLYNQIKLCSSYDEVKDLLGTDGSSTSDQDDKGIKSTTYEWRNQDSLISIGVTNNKVIFKEINTPTKVLAEPDFDKPNAVCN